MKSPEAGKVADMGENVVIQACECSLSLLPGLGGKIASLRIGQVELLQAPLLPYAPRTPSMSFDQSDASGWDECLPSVGQCSLETPAGTASVPDHGDLWRVPWKVLERAADSVTLRARCFSLPLQLTRSLIMSTLPGSGFKLQLLYSLTNLGAFDIPWAWSAHPLFAVAPNDRILLPDSVHTLHLEGSASNRLGLHNDIIPWPLATVAGSPQDLSHVLPDSTGIGDKLAAGPMQDGWAVLERPSVGLRLTVRFNPRLTPYLGLWICYGGWPDRPGPKQVAVALEPATSPVDSLAETGPWSRTLEPGDTFTWPIDLEITRNPEGRSH